jgi:hypothetical protein
MTSLPGKLRLAALVERVIFEPRSSARKRCSTSPPAPVAVLAERARVPQAPLGPPDQRRTQNRRRAIVVSMKPRQTWHIEAA